MLTLTRPRIDRVMELLARLGPEPRMGNTHLGASLRTLNAEICNKPGVRASVRDLIIQARERGYHVRVWQHNGEDRAGIDRRDFRKAQQDATEYVESLGD